jgi:hypothetical protein
MNITQFWSRIKVGVWDECWPWTGAKHAHGYGQLSMDGRRLYAHRVAYELTMGPIPERYEIDHVVERGCHHRDCCNPFHLEAVTPEENKRRSGWGGVVNAQKNQCKRGHTFTAQNTGIDSKGHRYCKECHRKESAIRRKDKQMNLEAQYG